MRRLPQSSFSTIALVCLLLVATSAPLLGRGKYDGTPVTQWASDGRTMTVVEEFSYTDSDGRRWIVPSGAKVDGASIPKVSWSLIGGPFDGKYRDASVIHDYFCTDRRRKWQDVHKVFHEAMLTSGVGKARAYVMFKAVEKFGPKWDEPKIDPKCLRPNGKFDFEKCSENSGVEVSPAVFPEAGKSELQQFLNEVEGEASPEDIETLRQAIDRAP